MKRSFVLLAIVCLLAVLPQTSAAVDARILGFPDVSEDHITFVYAGDIWTVPKSGGMATRLSSPAGEVRNRGGGLGYGSGYR